MSTVSQRTTGLCLHYDSHVDHRYKVGLIKTMLYRAYRLSSTWKAFTDEAMSASILRPRSHNFAIQLDKLTPRLRHLFTIKPSTAGPACVTKTLKMNPLLLPSRSKIKDWLTTQENSFSPWAAKSACAYNQFSQAGK